MGGRTIRSASAALLLACLASGAGPAASTADHIAIEASASASLERLTPGSGHVEVSWSITCLGAAAGAAEYGGSLTLVDLDTREEIYMGGVFSASGEATQIVARLDRDRQMAPRLRASCIEYPSLHGANLETFGGAATVPAKGGGGGGGGGGGHGGGGGGGGGGAGPRDPLGPGGCATELLGTPAPDRLDGGAGGDLILALGGGDRVRGRDGHDCLVGSSGRDRLLGEDGYDRLTGGSGRDRLDGGAGRNAYDAGTGDDRIRARNGRRETVRCGPGTDRARVDRRDRVRACERVARP